MTGWKTLGGATNFASARRGQQVVDDLDSEINASVPRSDAGEHVA